MSFIMNHFSDSVMLIYSHPICQCGYQRRYFSSFLSCPCIFSATLFSIYSSSLLQNWAIYQYNWCCNENKIQYSLGLINIMQGSSNSETNLNKKAVWGGFGKLKQMFLYGSGPFLIFFYLWLFSTYCQVNLSISVTHSSKDLKTTGIMSVSVKTTISPVLAHGIGCVHARANCYSYNYW